MMPVENEEDKVTVAPEDYLAPDSIKAVRDTVSKTTSLPIVDSAKVERTGMGMFLLSTKQKVQSLNLKDFFTTRPFQVSLTPA